jgi:RNA 2',3'-cyclic 3'-phosphodiesterase
VTVRAFVALDVDDASRGTLARLCAKLEVDAPRGLRFCAPGTLHVTMKFLGSVDDALLGPLGEGLSASAARAPSLARVTSLGAFPSEARASVLIAHLADPDGALARVASALDGLAEPLGVAREARDFRPHVTLARAKQPLDVRALLAAVPPPLAAIRFRALVLFRSEALPAGPRYTPLATHSIPPAAPAV